MIHSARQSAKFVKLVRRLRGLFRSELIDTECVAVGILERLWHAGINSCPRGDIGKLDNEMIAESVGWLGDGDVIVGILVECGWLDECQDHRLIIHDWREHSPGFVKRNIERRGGFVQLKRPLNRSSEHGSDRLTAQVSKEAPTPNLTEPNRTKPNQTKRKEDSSEPPAASKPTGFVFPVVGGDSKEWEVPQLLLERFADVYPSLDVRGEIRKAILWVETNATNRKTARGMPKFLNGWMGRTQNKGGGKSGNGKDNSLAFLDGLFDDK